MSIKSDKFDRVFSDPRNYRFDDNFVLYEVLEKLVFHSLLEVGCGNGRNLVNVRSYFPDVVVSGVELSRVGFDICQMHGLDVSLCDARRLPFDDGCFDVVLTVHSLEQMKYIVDDVLGEIFRVSSRYVVCFEPVFCLQNLFGKVHNFLMDYVRGLPLLLEKHGFNVLELRNLGVGSFRNRTCLLVGEKGDG